MRILAVVPLALAALVFAPPADADITVWLGRLSGEELLIEGTTAYGGAVGFSFAKYFGVEAVIDYMPDSELPFDLEELEELLNVNVRVDLLSISGNFLFQVPIQDTFVPYATIGYGIFGARVKADIANEPEAFGSTTALNWGFGAKIKLAHWFMIRGDIRWYRLDVTTDDLGDLVENIQNPTLNRMAVGVGFSF